MFNSQKDFLIGVVEMRVIACYTFILKIISKILGARLFLLLNRIISKNKYGFVKERYIGDNILLAHDLVSNYHLDKGKGNCALKIDLSKAYDYIS